MEFRPKLRRSHLFASLLLAVTLVTPAMLVAQQPAHGVHRE
jgi:hypothetical protein